MTSSALATRLLLAAAGGGLYVLAGTAARAQEPAGAPPRRGSAPKVPLKV